MTPTDVARALKGHGFGSHDFVSGIALKGQGFSRAATVAAILDPVVTFVAEGSAYLTGGA